jgi:autotransporter-associated beta strand protein
VATPASSTTKALTAAARGVTFFIDQSSADSANIGNAGGFTIFNGSSTAGGATIVNGGFGSLAGDGVTEFRSSATAGNALISNADHGATIFRDQTNAGFAKIFNDASFGPATLDFFDNSNASNATITNTNGGQTIFHDMTSGANATIINSAGGTTQFLDQSTADAPAIINATIINNNGGSTFFKDQSTAGLARLVANVGGVVDISGLTTAGMTAGSIEGAGTFFLGSKSLTVGGNNFSTEVSGLIADGGTAGGKGGSLVKVGSGTLILSGANSYTGATTLNEGR